VSPSSRPITNWGGNHAYRAVGIERPTTLGELQRLVATSSQLSALGTRHSFTAIGDGEVLVDLALLASPPVVDHDRGVVDVGGPTTYADLALALAPAGRALHNMASLPHISVAGAIATGTHGSGGALGNLSTAVEMIEMITASGELVVFRRGEADFDGVVVHLGALGLVTRLALRTEATYEVTQTVYDGLDWETLTGSFDDVFGSATSVSLFTQWSERPGELWCKQRVDREPDRTVTDRLRPAAESRHPIPGAGVDACTTQGGVAGPWWDRLPHFRADAEPSSGAEIQSEFFVDRSDSGAAIEALRRIGPTLDPLLLVGEIRTVAADQLWLSPCFGRDSTAFHFTWRRDSEKVAAAVERIGETLAPFAPRPHWGKVMPARWRAAESYDRLDDFVQLRRRLDPNARFLTPWVGERLG
jgi:xylitol oxidase